MERRVVIAGGTGQLGRLLAAFMDARGWKVVVLGRNPGFKVQDSEWGRVRYVRWDGRTVGEWWRELEGSAAVVNLAGRSVNCRYTARHRREIMDSRVISTHALGEAVGRCATPPPVWVNSSTATIYRHTFGPGWDEHGETGADREARDAFSIEVARAWEKTFFEAPTPRRVRKVALRTAIVLSREPENMVAIVRRLVRMGLGGRMGDGKQWVSWIHGRDFCRAVEWVIEREDFSGVVNVAAPNPVTNERMMGIFREVCGVRVGLPAARWMLELGAFFLRTEPELVLKSRRVVPGKLMAGGFGFEFSDMAGALRDLCHRGPRERELPSPMPLRTISH